ncbi:tRNA-dihydrouridine(16/17) synthase [NAD(P)(+)]-like isoform X4 [Stigmatopora argus]
MIQLKKIEKLQGFEFWKKTLKEACFVVAPMVDQSELSWRILSRRHGAHLCYTPMLHAQVFVRDANYRRENFYNEVCEEDRPLITQLLTVHGRTKDQKGAMTGIASWEHVREVRKAVNIPVFANGNIQHLSDVQRCIKETGVQGVMSAEGNLHNPAIFEGLSPPVWEMAEEYLEVVKQYPPCNLSYVRAHLFKLWHHTYAVCCVRLQIHQDLREELAKVKTLESLVNVSDQLKMRCQEEIASGIDTNKESSLPFPHWICQPYVRPPPKDLSAKGNSHVSQEMKGCQKRALEDAKMSTQILSKNKQKKMSRNPSKNFSPDQKPKYIKCEQCGNPKGNKCVFNLCRGCCKKKSFKEVANCSSHGLKFKSKADAIKAQQDQTDTKTEIEKDCSPPQSLQLQTTKLPTGDMP